MNEEIEVQEQDQMPVEDKKALAELETFVKEWANKNSGCVIGIAVIDKEESDEYQLLEMGSMNCTRGGLMAAADNLRSRFSDIVRELYKDAPEIASAGDGRVKPEDGGGSQGG